MERSSKVFPSQETPLYQQLYAYLREAILSGELKRGMQLPPTRALASQLNVSRNTVLNAYRQLEAEGYLDSIAGSGTYVAQIVPDSLLTAPAHDLLADTRRTEAPRPQFSESARLQLAVSRISPATPELRGRAQPFPP